MPAARPVARVTRRTVVVSGGVAAGLVTAGCGERAGGSSDAAATQEQGDDAVLAAVRAELAAAVAVVGATRRRSPALRARLADLQVAHEAQLAVLDPEGETPAADASDVPRDPDLALARLRASEERLQRRLLTWAVAVDSGPLARVLAAASAGTAQHLVALPGAGAS